MNRSQRNARSQAEDWSAETGTCHGRVLRFEPEELEDGGEEGLIGTLKIKPSPPQKRILKLQILDDDTTHAVLAGHELDLNLHPELLGRGLFCSVDWAVRSEDERRRSRRPHRVLRSLRFDTLEVHGEINEMGAEYLVVKGRPVNDVQWPDVAEYLSRTHTNRNPDSHKRPIRKKLELRFIEDVTAFVDAAGHPLFVADFGPGDEVDALIVYGRKDGLLVELRSTIASELPAEREIKRDRQDKSTSGPRPRTGTPRARPRGRIRR